MLPVNRTNLIAEILFLILIATLPDRTFSQEEVIEADTIRSCKTDSLLISALSGFDKYLWSNGDTTENTWISVMGDYLIEGTLGDTTYIDSVFVGIVDAQILEINDSIVCGDTVTLYGSSDAYDYLWLPGNETTDSILISPRDTTYYYALITDPVLTINHCLDSILVTVNEILFVDSLIQSKMGCPDSAVARVQVYISGGYPPYSYAWSDGIPNSTDSSKVTKLTNGEKKLIVEDSIGCLLKHTFEVKAFPLPEIELTSDPPDSVYLQKPFVNFTYENLSYDSLMADTFYLNSIWWDFLGSDSSFLYDVESPTYTYTTPGTYQVYFHYRTFYGCEDTGSVHIQMVVKPVKLRASSVITPNDDGNNDLFIIFEDNGTTTGGSKSTRAGNTPIDLSKYYISNTLVVFNRWGQKVFEANNYNNDWDAKGLSDGVYFYILECDGYYEDRTIKGSVTIISHRW